MSPERIKELATILAEAEGLPADIVLRQCQAESGFEQAARSPRGAIGLFQLMSATARELGVDPEKWHENIWGAVRYLAALRRQFGTIDKALAAYNWGPGHLARLLAEHPQDWRSHLPAETEHYLSKILTTETA